MNKPWWEYIIIDILAAMVGSFIHGIIIWLVQYFAFHATFTYWQCFWAAFALLTIMEGAAYSANKKHKEMNG